MFRWQIGQCRAHQLRLLATVQRLIGGDRGFRHQRGVVRIDLGPTIASERIDALVAGNGENPAGGDTATGIEQAGLAPDRHHGLLHQLLCPIAVGLGHIGFDAGAEMAE
ncbi:hypothetical protein D3C72_1776900 [compost metagenome]